MKSTKLKEQVTDPTVINDTLISQAVRDYQIEHKIVINTDQIDFKTIQVLQLSYKNILKIQNLDGLFRLEKLQLDNNLIEQIANLDHLINLKWLDLSFNCIREITGLNNLTNITDLSLYNNQITKVENIENLTKLNVFSIGNNKLESIDSIIGIFGQKTKIKNCEVINVKGNPFTLKDSEYKLSMIYLIINLKYLDYEFIDEKQKQAVYESDKFQSDLAHEQMVKTLQQEEESQKEKQSIQRDKQLSRMDLINNLAEELTTDPDLDRVKLLKGVEDEIVKFQENIKEIVDQLQKQIIAKNKVKLQYIDKFMEAIYFREKQSYEQTIQILRSLENQKKKVFKKIDDNHPSWRQDAEALIKKILKDKDELLSIEIQLMEEIDASVKNFDSILAQLKKEIDEIAKPNNAKILDLIKEFQLRVLEISKTEFEKYINLVSSNGDLSEWNDETQQILENKETLQAIVGNIKDSLTAKADKKDGEINKCISEDIDNFFKQEKDRQYQRNRENVQQIIKETQLLTDLIQQRLQKPETDSDEG